MGTDELEDEAGVETVAEVYDARDMRARFVDEHVLLVGIILTPNISTTPQHHNTTTPPDTRNKNKTCTF